MAFSLADWNAHIVHHQAISGYASIWRTIYNVTFSKKKKYFRVTIVYRMLSMEHSNNCVYIIIANNLWNVLHYHCFASGVVEIKPSFFCRHINEHMMWKFSPKKSAHGISASSGVKNITKKIKAYIRSYNEKFEKWLSSVFFSEILTIDWFIIVRLRFYWNVWYLFIACLCLSQQQICGFSICQIDTKWTENNRKKQIENSFLQNSISSLLNSDIEIEFIGFVSCTDSFELWHAIHLHTIQFCIFVFASISIFHFVHT